MQRTTMHSKIIRAAAILCLLTPYKGEPQGTFVNLDFESAVVPSVPAGQFGADVPVTNGVPGWGVYLGGLQQSSMLHNNLTLSAAAVAILGPTWFSNQILENSYTVSLLPSTTGPQVDAAIAQTGQIPASAHSVQFWGSGGYTVTFSGQPIPVTAIGNGPNYPIFGGDVSMFADQTGELRFTGAGLLDNIVFSSQAIPEPGTIALSGLALVACVTRLRKKLKR